MGGLRVNDDIETIRSGLGQWTAQENEFIAALDRLEAELKVELPAARQRCFDLMSEVERLETAVVDRVLLLDRAKRAEAEIERLREELLVAKSNAKQIAAENERLRVEKPFLELVKAEAEVERLREENERLLEVDREVTRENERLRETVKEQVEGFKRNLRAGTEELRTENEKLRETEKYLRGDRTRAWDEVERLRAVIAAAVRVGKAEAAVRASLGGSTFTLSAEATEMYEAIDRLRAALKAAEGAA